MCVYLNAVAITPLPTYPVTHEAVFEILHAIAANWKAIGQQLKINEDLEDEIDTNNEHDEDCLDEVVKFWLMNCDFQNTWAELADAVEKAGEQQLSERIRAEKGISGKLENGLFLMIMQWFYLMWYYRVCEV